ADAAAGPIDFVDVCTATQTAVASSVIRGWLGSSFRRAGRIRQPEETRMRLEPVHHTIVAMDVAGSGRRDDLLQLRMRADLREIVAGTLAAQSLDVAALHHTDLGDVLRLIVAGSDRPAVSLDPFV